MSTRAPPAVRTPRPISRAQRVVPSSKRPRSPDNDGGAQDSAKRRALEVNSKDVARQDKERRQTERAEQAEEFRVKYGKAFPGFTFYFDAENLDVEPQSLQTKIHHLEGNIDDFFSKHITHFITDYPIASDKENNPKAYGRRAIAAKSPVKLPNRNNELVKKAQGLGLKIWSSAKLESVLDRCLPSTQTSSASRSTNPTPAPSRNQLAQLLERERVNGSTERDPSQRRHDYKYFKRGSCFVLVEDLDQKVATIIAKEYPGPRDDALPEYPTLHCHPQSRNPFIPFDAKEKRKWEKSQREEKERHKKKESDAAKQERLRFKRVQQQQQSRRLGDLRRAVSMNNLRRELEPEDDEDVPQGSANASGYFSGNVAASGNSVAITSTIGTTTSTSGHTRPAATSALLKGMAHKEIFTSRKAGKTLMGPPPVPSKLKKSKSMNTMKQPKRQEGQKPGYCECCRVTFKDFKTHAATDRKHRKFAKNDDNFAALDIVLNRIQRKRLPEPEDDLWDPIDSEEMDL